MSERMEIVGTSKPLQDALDLADLFAPHTVSVLITGENGTGKELLAHRIHDRSGRKGKMVAVNCGAIPENLMESEFFGHTKSAFTGADKPRCGLFKTADGGTMFLDEIGELPLQLQVKLLRVLESGELTPVGSSTSEKIDVRIIAATNRDLWQMVEQGDFREDLYWRIHGLEINLPALRDRGEDIVVIAEHFLAQLGHAKTLGASAKALIRAHSWSGNCRELRSAVIAAAIISRDSSVIEESHFALSLRRACVQIKSPSVIDSIPAPEMTPEIVKSLAQEGLECREVIEEQLKPMREILPEQMESVTTSSAPAPVATDESLQADKPVPVRSKTGSYYLASDQMSVSYNGELGTIRGFNWERGEFRIGLGDDDKPVEFAGSVYWPWSDVLRRPESSDRPATGSLVDSFRSRYAKKASAPTAAPAVIQPMQPPVQMHPIVPRNQDPVDPPTAIGRTKVCPICKQTKLLLEGFGVKNGKDKHGVVRPGFQASCKDCRKGSYAAGAKGPRRSRSETVTT